MKNLYTTAKALTKDTQKLTNRLFRFTSATSDNKESLATLAADAATLAYQFAGLRVDIIEQHEKDQRNEI